MKKIKLLFIFILAAASSHAQHENPIYDSILAKKLGSDEYGMKQYVLVILKTGTNLNSDSKYLDSCFTSHMNNIKYQVKEGKMIVAGPLVKNEKNYRGIFILNTNSLEEAKEILKDDLAISEKILEIELFNWYGSAALPEYLESSEKIWKKGF